MAILSDTTIKSINGKTQEAQDRDLQNSSDYLLDIDMRLILLELGLL